MARSLARETEVNDYRQDALLTGTCVRGFTREGVMRDLADLFRICYKFGRYLNPLPGVRKCFPGLLWNYWVDNSCASEIERHATKRIAETSDFVWLIGDYEIVTASCKARPEEGFLYHLFLFGLDGLKHIAREDFASRF